MLANDCILVNSRAKSCDGHIKRWWKCKVIEYNSDTIHRLEFNHGRPASPDHIINLPAFQWFATLLLLMSVPGRVYIKYTYISDGKRNMSSEAFQSLTGQNHSWLHWFPHALDGLDIHFGWMVWYACMVGIFIIIHSVHEIETSFLIYWFGWLDAGTGHSNS